MTDQHPDLTPVAGGTLDHIAIATSDIVASQEPYLLLDYTPGEVEEVRGQGVRVLMLSRGDDRIELLEPLDDQSPVARFLERRGQGMHHIAFRVDDLDAAVHELRERGATFTSETPRPGHGDSRVIFLHPRWAGGVLIELLQRPA